MFGYFQWTFDVISIWIIIVVNWIQSCIPDTVLLICVIAWFGSAGIYALCVFLCIVHSILNLVFEAQYFQLVYCGCQNKSIELESCKVISELKKERETHEYIVHIFSNVLQSKSSPPAKYFMRAFVCAFIYIQALCCQI